MLEVAGRRVMDGVGAAPIPIGKKGHDSEHGADHVIGVARGEERAVATVVLQDEEANEQETRGHRELFRQRC